MWATALIVGLASLKLLPAKRLREANLRLRSRLPGIALIILYVVICVLFFVGVFFLCLALGAPEIVRNVILGVLIGLAIGFVPLIDPRNTDEEDAKKAELKQQAAIEKQSKKNKKKKK